MTRRPARLAALALTAGTALSAGIAGPVSAQEGGPTFPPADERCKVPPLLFQVAFVVDPDSLEGCGFFEDSNFSRTARKPASSTRTACSPSSSGRSSARGG